MGYKGLFYHFLDMETALRTWSSELSSIDTALLLAGILHARQYFTEQNENETTIRQLADSIHYRVDWEWMRNGQPNITLGWHPESGFIPSIFSTPASVWNIEPGQMLTPESQLLARVAEPT